MIGFSLGTALGIAAGLAIFALYAALRPQTLCSNCEQAQPRLNPPKSLSQALLMWRQCPHCQAKLSSRGRLLAD